MKQFVRNVSYSFIANIVSLLVSVCMVMVVPKLLSVEDYGLWQLFLFYLSYIGFFHFGWEDGIYLRYAGKSFEELDRKLFAGQYYLLTAFQILLAVAAFSFANLFVDDPVKKIAASCTALLIPFVNFNNLCNFIMQITNRIKDYACMLLIERLMLLILVMGSLLLGFNQFTNLYVAKLCSVGSVTILSFWLCRSLIRPNFPPAKDVFSEAYENMSVGIKLMFANIASMLIIGIIRYGISMGWNVATFGKVSLTLGISNFLMVFINSVSIVFFPYLKRLDQDRLPSLYIKVRGILTLLLLMALLGYYPLKFILSWWLPKYADSLIYMVVLFPICLFESKVSLLINTYLKSMRKEALMLKINATSVLVSAAVTVITVWILHNLNLAIFSIVFLYAFRCILAECYLGNLLSIKLHKPIILDLIMVGIFMASGILLDSWICMFVYGVVYVIYVISHRAFAFQLLKALKK